jgi:RNA polymerase sigma factor (sigma-70 family)
MIEAARKPYLATLDGSYSQDWDRLLAGLRPHLMRVLEMRGVDREQAEDHVQEALALIWRKLATLREPPRLASWATTIVLNQLRSHRVRHRSFEGIPHALTGPWPEPPEILMRAEGRAWVARALDSLPREQEETVRLRFREGLSPRGITRALDVSMACFRHRLREGLRHLRRRGQTTQGRAAAAALGLSA